jgi:hypothetical protein
VRAAKKVRGHKTDAALAEGDPNSGRLTPYHAAGQFQPFVRKTQNESSGDFNFAEYFQCGTAGGEVANKATSLTATGPDRPGLQDKIAGRSATFGHHYQTIAES